MPLAIARMVVFADVELFNFELFFNQFIFFLAIDFFNDIVGRAKSPYPVVHVYTVHAL